MPTFSIINRFLEDTCVIATLAYLISRGPLLPKLFSSKRRVRDIVALAVVFGLAGGSELIFPGERYPYIIFTLAASFAAYAGGLGLGLMASVVMILLATVGLLTGHDRFSLCLYVLSLVAANLAGALAAKMRSLVDRRFYHSGKAAALFLAGACVSGAVGEALHRLLLLRFVSGLGAWDVLDTYSVSSNAFGSLLLGLVLWDVNKRHEASERQIQTERQLVNLRSSQLAELQARLHPHFLFNALAGLAGLCALDPRRAERGITDLAALLRRFLRAPGDVSIPLRDEIENVRSYLAIERLRLEDRLQVVECVPDDALSFLVPQFALQVPVENAIEHGVAASDRPVTVSITARRHAGRLTLAVSDNGSGDAKSSTVAAPISQMSNDRPHGLTLLAARLQLAHGDAARLRLFLRPGRGSVCVLRLPAGESTR